MYLVNILGLSLSVQMGFKKTGVMILMAYLFKGMGWLQHGNGSNEERKILMEDGDQQSTGRLICKEHQ